MWARKWKIICCYTTNLESDLKEIKICSSHFESVFGTLSCQRKQEWLELGTLLFYVLVTWRDKNNIRRDVTSNHEIIIAPFRTVHAIWHVGLHWMILALVYTFSSYIRAKRLWYLHAVKTFWGWKVLSYNKLHSVKCFENSSSFCLVLSDLDPRYKETESAHPRWVDLTITL